MKEGNHARAVAAARLGSTDSNRRMKRFLNKNIKNETKSNRIKKQKFIYGLISKTGREFYKHFENYYRGTGSNSNSEGNQMMISYYMNQMVSEDAYYSLGAKLVVLNEIQDISTQRGMRS